MNLNTSTIPVFILAGGLGTRLSEETNIKPKPMVEVGDIPIIVHIMRWYYSFGFNDFVICAGYKSWEIKDYFINYKFRQNSISIDHRTYSEAKPHIFGQNQTHEEWRVRVLDTGLESMTGARIAKAVDAIAEEQPFEHFALTYGDGVSDAPLTEELNFHIKHGKIGTMLGVPHLARFGEVTADQDGRVTAFVEKPQSKQSAINGGFFFFKKEFRDYLTIEDNCILEKAPLEKLASDQELFIFPHKGFWQCMDTLRDKHYLQEIWKQEKAPWLPKK